MKTPAILLAAAAVAGATSAALTLVLSPPRARGPAPAPGPVEPDGLTALARELDALRRSSEEQARELEELRLAATRPASAARVPLDEIDKAVRRHLAGLDVPPVPGSAGAAQAGTAAVPPLPSGDELFARLLEADLDDGAVQLLWQEVRDAGRTDEVLALFEARADAAPNDPDLRVDLGEAYLQKIQEVGSGPLAGVYATKADQAFDRALELDPGHWNARFDKAIALSFWPPVFGKQTAAIQQFEILVEKQRALGAEPRFAATHLLLGNMYQQIGEAEKARAAWRLGLELFPEDEDLRAQLARADGG